MSRKAGSRGSSRKGEDDGIVVPEWLSLLDPPTDPSTGPPPDGDAVSSQAPPSLSSTAKSRPSSSRRDRPWSAGGRGVGQSMREAVQDMYRAAHNNGETPAAPVGIGRVDEEVLARDVLVADLTAQIEAAKLQLAKKKKTHNKTLGKEKEKTDDLKDRLERLEHQNGFFRDALQKGRFGTTLTD
eukprot:CAMPEP_0114172530 /NCGR_PEP_ID=MMETSP0043_2-20121206/35331_1 /TAXON_ID=464988 /ORGANISM="Hemiselmis andersenii, Strain CCMP644" /LENGTH=183 /DNA_ID=CAMNT_0001270425 /DNA_START=24 /DNA_END=572 /DNA_ORIENTATION=+